MAFNIKISERSYGGKKFRPNTEVDFESSNNLLLCVTSWGQKEISTRVTESIKSFISMSGDDTERTMLYAKKDTLNRMGNALRMAVISASEKIYKEFNQDEYTSGFEIFAAIQEGPQWIYVSCGQPSLVLCRKSMGIIPLFQSIDLNVINPQSSILNPLPNHLLGLGQHPPIHYGNIRLKKNDRLALISRTYLPNSFFKMPVSDFNSDNISQSLANDQLDTPFWLGLIDID